MTVRMHCSVTSSCPFWVEVDGYDYAAAREKLERHKDRAHELPDPRPATDGSQIEPPSENRFHLDGPPRARVVFVADGEEFRSRPLPIQRAEQLADAIGDATVPIELGEQPLAFDERARLEPVEATDE